MLEVLRPSFLDVTQDGINFLKASKALDFFDKHKDWLSYRVKTRYRANRGEILDILLWIFERIEHKDESNVYTPHAIYDEFESILKYGYDKNVPSSQLIITLSVYMIKHIPYKETCLFEYPSQET
jgi:hypothetical protein